jgi:hypothetical protein
MPTKPSSTRKTPPSPGTSNRPNPKKGEPPRKGASRRGMPGQDEQPEQPVGKPEQGKPSSSSRQSRMPH